LQLILLEDANPQKKNVIANPRTRWQSVLFKKAIIPTFQGDADCHASVTGAQ